MKIPIEVLSVVFLIFIFFIWLIYFLLSNLWLKFRYNTNNDKSRLGEEERRRNSLSHPATSGVTREGKFKEQGLLQPSSFNSTGKNSTSIGKTSNSIRNFFQTARK